MNYKKLQNEWKERLGLQDWIIRFYTNCKSEEVNDGQSIGESIWETTSKSAIVKIIDEKEYSKEYMIPYDFEKNVGT